MESEKAKFARLCTSVGDGLATATEARLAGACVLTRALVWLQCWLLFEADLNNPAFRVAHAMTHK